MKSYKDYKQAADIASAQGATEGQTDERTASSAEELTRKIAAAYNGKSNMTMLKSILEEAEKSKRAGTLSNEEIESFYQSFAPMLSGFQRKQLRGIIERLKEI